MSDDVQAVEQLRAAHQKLRGEIGKIIVGQEDVLDQLLDGDLLPQPCPARSACRDWPRR